MGFICCREVHLFTVFRWFIDSEDRKREVSPGF